MNSIYKIEIRGFLAEVKGCKEEIYFRTTADHSHSTHPSHYGTEAVNRFYFKNLI